MSMGLCCVPRKRAGLDWMARCSAAVAAALLIESLDLLVDPGCKLAALGRVCAGSGWLCSRSSSTFSSAGFTGEDSSAVMVDACPSVFAD